MSLSKSISRTIPRLAALSLLLLMLALAVPTHAGEGRTPLFEPTTIVADGKYIVTRDIVGGGVAPVIDVAAANVDIDLNGFTLSNGAGLGDVITVSVPVTQVTIRNGTLDGGGSSIDATLAAGGEKIVIEDIKSQSAGGDAIHILDIESPVIRRAVIEGAAGAGILIDGAGLHLAKIEDCTIREVVGIGISFTTGSATIQNNKVNSGAASTILLSTASGSLVSDNTVVGGPGTGILLTNGDGNRLFNNVVRDMGLHGIQIDALSTDNAALNNSVSNCGAAGGGSGIFVMGDRNQIERNVLNANAGFGLRFIAGADSNTFGRNMARGNVGGAPGPCAGVDDPPNYCNDGVANDSYADNLIDGPLF
jgi:parallel beta-helix repeat protein